ncbi:MAG: hypothetical protein AAFX87_14715 [Bacteroidota bacterium]
MDEQQFWDKLAGKLRSETAHHDDGDQPIPPNDINDEQALTDASMIMGVSQRAINNKFKTLTERIMRKESTKNNDEKN